MQTRWNTLFTPASYGPLVDGGPARELVSAGELGPPDLLAHEVRHYLRQDETLAAIFGPRFDVMPWLSPADARTFPRLAVYLASSANSERPTATAVEQVSVFVGTMWDIQSTEPVEDGRATVATVLYHVKRVMRARGTKVLVIWKDDTQRQLAHELVGISAERFIPSQDLEGRTNGIVHELEFLYRVHVDISGQLVNLM